MRKRLLFPLISVLALLALLFLAPFTRLSVSAEDSLVPIEEWTSSPIVQLKGPTAIAISRTKAYIADPAENAIFVYNTTAGKFSRKFVPQNYTFTSPVNGLAVDSRERIYVIQGTPPSPVITAFNANGSLIADFGKGGMAGSSGSGGGDQNSGWTGIAIDAKDDILAVDGKNQRIKRFSKIGFMSGDFGYPGFASLANPLQIAYDPTVKTSLFVLDNGKTVKKITADFQSITNFAQGLDSATAICAGKGRVYVLDNNKVKCFDKDGQLVWTFDGTGTGKNKYSKPIAIAADIAGFVFVVDAGQNKVIKYKPAR